MNMIQPYGQSCEVSRVGLKVMKNIKKKLKLINPRDQLCNCIKKYLDLFISTSINHPLLAFKLSRQRGGEQVQSTQHNKRICKLCEGLKICNLAVDYKL